ncbi:hypothetical protein [Bacillus sp. FJAT-45037]|uniref:hypothetical protein n=1 Tax=Bacillus sp. FJAT-45037 TaxID=2011007 RepID=UPI001E2B10C2|nr:hypothetical protein [Bacillus sp. FJAT-45037]
MYYYDPSYQSAVSYDYEGYYDLRQAPTGPPPQTIPMTASGPQAFAVDPGAIQRCLFRFTFIRLNNGDSFWFYPTFVGRNSVAGYRWWYFRWVNFGIDLRRISSFQCV